MTFSQNIIAFFSSMSGDTAYLAIFAVLFACGLGVPIPEDITIISAGILVALGKISFAGALSVCMIGVLVGDSLLFFIGRRYGKRAYTLPIIRKFAKPERIMKVEKWVNEHSRFICFIARFLPGLRSITYLTAGTMGIRPIIFWTQDGAAAIFSVPLWICFGYYFGNNIDGLLNHAKDIHNYLIVGAAAFAILYFGWKKVIKRFTPQ